MASRPKWTRWAMLGVGGSGGLALLTTVACTAAPMTHGDASGLLGGGLLTLFVLLITD